MYRESSIVHEKSLAAYFRERLHELAEELRPRPHEDTLWYLGNMLSRFGHSKQLFCYEDGRQTLRPLALLYGDARQAETTRDRHLILRQLGDMSLFFGGVFPEVYLKKGIHKDYLVGMGGGAYAYLSNDQVKNPHIFSELADTFTSVLELVARACAKSHVFDATDILGLYQRWRLSKDPAAKKQLEAVGITVSDQISLQ